MAADCAVGHVELADPTQGLLGDRRVATFGELHRRSRSGGTDQLPLPVGKADQVSGAPDLDAAEPGILLGTVGRRGAAKMMASRRPIGPAIFLVDADPRAA
jgi:hypothetical protein